MKTSKFIYNLAQEHARPLGLWTIKVKENRENRSWEVTVVKDRMGLHSGPYFKDLNGTRHTFEVPKLRNINRPKKRLRELMTIAMGEALDVIQVIDRLEGKPKPERYTVQGTIVQGASFTCSNTATATVVMTWVTS